MSNRRAFSGFSGGRVPEKSKFSHTCSLLSQYLKEKGSFGDLSIVMTGNLEGNPETSRPATAFELEPKTGTSKGDLERAESVWNQNPAWMNKLPQRVRLPDPVENVHNPTHNELRSTHEPLSATMTILYGGKVVVIEDLPAEKAKELMLLASKGSSQGVGSSTSPNPDADFAPAPAAAPVLAPAAAPVLAPAAAPSPPTNSIQQQPPPADGSGNFSHNSYLPIARKVSLHRFLEKRKGRISSKAPYPVTPAAAAQAKPADTKSWLGLSSWSG